MLALDVEREELYLAEDVGALSLGSVLGGRGLDAVGDAASLESPGESADPGHGGHAHALQLRCGGKRLEFVFRGERVGFDEVGVAVKAARGDPRVLGAALRAVLVVRRDSHGGTLARPRLNHREFLRRADRMPLLPFAASASPPPPLTATVTATGADAGGPGGRPWNLSSA